jgi:hypothetical protein
MIRRAILIVAASHALATSAWPAEDGSIPPWSPELEQRLQPGCEKGCVHALPFTAVYRKGDSVLVFVAARHEFTPKNNTLRAVDAGFAAVSPAIVILEGFPTAMGENPPPLVETVRKRDTPEANDFSKGEAGYTALIALARGIPFLGGEPTRAEQVQALGRKGYAPSDIAFSYLAGGLAQSLRARNISGTTDPKLRDVFAHYADAFADQYQLTPMSFDEFSARYRSMFGVEITADTQLTTRSDPGTTSPLALLNQTDMLTRDEHLLSTIEQQVLSKKRVLVVYGVSHWTTLSQALQKRLGKPKVTLFRD